MPFLGCLGVGGDFRNGNVEKWTGSLPRDWSRYIGERQPPPSVSKLTIPNAVLGLHAARVDCSLGYGGLHTHPLAYPRIRPDQFVLLSAWCRLVSGPFMRIGVRVHYKRQLYYHLDACLITITEPGVWKHVSFLWQVTHPGANFVGIFCDSAPTGSVFDVDDAFLLVGLDLSDDVQEISEQINLQSPPSSPERLGASLSPASVEGREFQLEFFLNDPRRLQTLLSVLGMHKHSELRLYVPDSRNPSLDNAFFVPVVPASFSGGWMSGLFGVAGRFPVTLKPSVWGTYFSAFPGGAGKALTGSGDSLSFPVTGSAPTPLTVRLLCSRSAAAGNPLSLTLTTPFRTIRAQLRLRENFPKANDALVLNFLKGTAEIVSDGTDADATELFSPQETQLLIAEEGPCSLSAEWSGAVAFSHMAVEYYPAWWVV